MAPLPRTREGLEAVGYKFSTMGSCRGCGVQIQWYVTPEKKWMPFDRANQMGEFENHWGSCPARQRFKKK